MISTMPALAQTGAFPNKTIRIIVPFAPGGSVDLISRMISPKVRAKKLRAPGVSSRTRSPAFPEIPTVHESGLPGYDFMTWFALVAPAKTPRAAVTHLNDQMRKSLATPELAKLFADLGLDIVASTPDAASEHLQKEAERWARVVKERGMRAE